MQPTQPTVEETARAFPFRGHDFCSNVMGARRLDSWKNRHPKKVLAGVAEMEGGEVVAVSGAGNHAKGSLSLSPLNCSAGWLAWTTPSPNRPRWLSPSPSSVAPLIRQRMDVQGSCKAWAVAQKPLGLDAGLGKM